MNDARADIRSLCSDEIDAVSGGSMFSPLVAAAVEQALRNADTNRGQAEKRLSDHRNEMRRNWAP